jgi:hypothetical protein
MQDVLRSRRAKEDGCEGRFGGGTASKWIG